MFGRKKKLNKLNENLEKINSLLTKNNILDLPELLGNKKQLLIRNLLSGMSKGIGIGVGFTIVTALIIFLLQKLVKLNLPIVGKYIADIVEIVQQSR